jgi:hypothetical protein
LGFSVLLNNLERGAEEAGVATELFSNNVFGVYAQSKSLNGLTVLYGGETGCCCDEIELSLPGVISFTSFEEEASEFTAQVKFAIGLLESRNMSKPCSILAPYPELVV